MRVLIHIVRDAPDALKPVTFNILTPEYWL
jgi:hypothetical protein